jgi:hypothetical protein
MILASQHPYPEQWPDAVVPAFVEEDAATMTAVAWHPSGRNDHENLLLLVARLNARGFRVTVKGGEMRRAA